MTMVSEAGSAVAQHRQRLREQGLQRVEVLVYRQDAALLRSVAAALADPQRAAGARAALLAGFSPPPVHSLKDLIASAPLDGIDFERLRDTGRVVDL